MAFKGHERAASRTAIVSCSIDGELPSGRAEIPIIATGSADAVGEHDFSEIGF